MLMRSLFDFRFYSKCWGLKGFAFPLRVTPHSVGRCHVVTEGTAAVSGGGGVSRRMRWKSGNKYVVYFMVLNAVYTSSVTS